MTSMNESTLINNALSDRPEKNAGNYEMNYQ